MYTCKYTYKCVLGFFYGPHFNERVWLLCSDVWLQNLVPQPRNIV